jgi:hyperosmotically inducible periplasmic protein
MRIKKSFVIFVVFAFAFVLSSCQQEGAIERAGKDVDKTVELVAKKIEKTGDAIGNKVEIAMAALDDTAITAIVKAEIFNDSLLKVTEIEVATTDGVVKLSGAVDSQTGIDRAQEIARGVKDVKAVDNRLVIKG